MDLCRHLVFNAHNTHTKNNIWKLHLPSCIAPRVDFYVMDSSPDAAVIDYTRQKEIESQVAVSPKKAWSYFYNSKNTILSEISA